jgi:hypothetical protein
MLLPNMLRKVFARLFSRLPLGGFPVLAPLRRPCPATARFRPSLEMLELRMMPTVTANYNGATGVLMVDATSSNSVTAMTVTGSTNNQVTLALTGDTFTLAGSAASSSSSDFVLSNGSATLLIYTASAPLVNFNISQLNNSEPLTFGLAATTSGVSNISITGTGDAVTFTAINNNVSGYLTDTSGSVTVSGAITVGGSVSLTGLGVGSGTTNNWGVVLGSSVTAGTSGSITITGTGSGSGSGHNYGVATTSSGALSAGGSVTITGTGQGTGTNNFGVALGSTVTAGSSGSITITGIGSGNGSGQDYGVATTSSGAVSAGGSVTVTGTGQGSGSGNVGVQLAGDVQAGTSGNVTLCGSVGSGGYMDNDGVYVQAGVSAGVNVTITGTGNGTGNSNMGVYLYNNGDTVDAVNGTLTICGSSSSLSGAINDGVAISNGAQVQVSGTGALTITGTGGLGSGFLNGGVRIAKGGTAILGSSGGISITGTARGHGDEAFGVTDGYGQIQASSTGSVSLVGQAPGSTPALDFTDGSGITVATGNVTLTGDVIDLGDTNSILSTSQSGTSQLLFQSYTHGRSIVVGGANDAANALTFTSTDLAAIVQGGSNYGFGLITIGSANEDNPMSIVAAITFDTNLSLVAKGGLTLKIPNAPHPAPSESMLVVLGTLNLNSDPLHLIAPSSAPANAAKITLIHTTLGFAGSIFYALPQGSRVTDSAGHSYTVSYTGDNFVLTASGVAGASPGAGTGRGRG